MTFSPTSPAVRNLALLGVLLFLGGNFMYAVNDALGKWLVTTFSVGQLLVLRSVGSFLVLGFILSKQGVGILFHLERVDLQILRVVLAIADTALFFAAVAYLPLADVLTFYMAGPIYVAALSHLFLGEKVGWRRWMAILVGFCGVIIALRPSSAAFSLPSLFALVGSVCFACMLVLSRRLRGTSDTALVTWQVAASLVFGLVIGLPAWKPMSGIELSAMLLLGVISCFAQLMVTRSLKLAPASVLAPMQYSILIWGIVFGYIFFNDVPDRAIIIGSGIIVLAGLFIFHRQKTVSEVPKETVPTVLP
jgi:S-adenosylmethionine uptake transporter